MILIAHRGNVNGSDIMENHPNYIDTALKAGFDAEIDLWLMNDSFMLGHDVPQYRIEKNWLIERKGQLWCHAKHVDILPVLLNNDLHCFFHDSDDVTLTSKNYIWTYPGKQLTAQSIAVMPEMLNTDKEPNNGIDWLEKQEYLGICSDFVSKYRN